MNASTAVTYDQNYAMYYAADDTPFYSYQEAVNYNINVLGIKDDSSIGDFFSLGDTFGGYPQASGASSNGGISPGIIDFNPSTSSDYLPLNTTGMNAPSSPSDSIWNFLGNLAQTTMQSAGTVINTRLQSEINAAQASANNRLNTTSTPATDDTTTRDLVVVGGILLVVGAAVMLRNRKGR